jgi:hypothetical protein
MGNVSNVLNVLNVSKLKKAKIKKAWSEPEVEANAEEETV